MSQLALKLGMADIFWTMFFASETNKINKSLLILVKV